MSEKVNGKTNGALKPLESQGQKKDKERTIGCEPDHHEDPPLPPDGGWGWVVMFASFFINLIVDGVCYTFGIINVELKTTFEEASTAETALVGSLVPAVYLMVGPFVSILANQFGCRSITIVGSIIASVFFFISSFSNSIIMMMLTYGVMGGIGFGMMYLPSIVMVGYYFDKYRALATGIAVCGSGIGTFVFAPMATYLVDEYSWRGCNIIMAGIILHGILFGATFRPLRRKHPKGHSIPRSNVMEEIKQQKQRNRTLSGDSVHDGAVIAHDNSIIFKPDVPAIEEKGKGDCGQGNGHSMIHPPVDQTHHRVSLRLGSRVSIRSGSKPEVLNVMDRVDILYPGSIRSLREFKDVGGDHAKYVQSVLTLEDSNRSRWKEFEKKALTLFDFTLLRSLTFVVLCFSGVLVFTGLFTPFVYLQLKAKELGSTKEAANMMILFLGVFNTVSRIATGALADRPWIDCLVIHNVGAIVAGVTTCIVPVLNSYLLLCLYAAVFGIAIASFIALRSIVFVEMLGIKKLNNAFGLTSLFQGIAVLIGSPISGALYDQTGSLTTSFIVCGILILLGGIICLPVRRITAWEHRKDNDNGPGSQYRRINGDTSTNDTNLHETV